MSLQSKQGKRYSNFLQAASEQHYEDFVRLLDASGGACTYFRMVSKRANIATSKEVSKQQTSNSC